ncbi:hypothetical protein M1E08_11640 [Erwinia sp. PK3-005]
MLGEAADALEAGDIYAFEEALYNVSRDFSAIADVFSFRNELETGNLLLSSVSPARFSIEPPYASVR